jgi:hypothetical protein
MQNCGMKTILMDPAGAARNKTAREETLPLAKVEDGRAKYD